MARHVRHAEGRGSCTDSHDKQAPCSRLRKLVQVARRACARGGRQEPVLEPHAPSTIVPGMALVVRGRHGAAGCEGAEAGGRPSGSGRSRAFTRLELVDGILRGDRTVASGATTRARSYAPSATGSWLCLLDGNSCSARRADAAWTQSDSLYAPSWVGARDGLVARRDHLRYRSQFGTIDAASIDQPPALLRFQVLGGMGRTTRDE